MGCAASAGVEANQGATGEPVKPSSGGAAAKGAQAPREEDKNAFVRNWVDAGHDNAADGSHHDHKLKVMGRGMSRVASRAGRSTISFSHKKQVPAVELKREPLDFHDPVYAKLLRRTPIKEAYDVDIIEEDRGELGTFRLMADPVTGETYTCRTVSKMHLEGPEELCMLQAEVEAMHTLAGYAGIIGLHALYEDDQAFHLVLDHCPAGDLFDRVMEQGCMAEADAAAIVAQILKTVHYIHMEKGLMHRDISLENIFLVEAPPMKKRDSGAADTNGAGAAAKYKVKLGGFASCTFFKPGQQFTDIVGSSYYIGPEVLRRSHGSEADIWSVGVLLYMMLCGKPPFSGDDEMEIFTNVMSVTPEYTGPAWSNISHEAIDLVQQMLNFEPELRSPPEVLLMHEWIQKHLGPQRMPQINS